jgi:acetylglutamate kinase
VSRIVLKLGGRVAAAAAGEALALHAAGHQVVVVHGAGPQITTEMERRGIVPSFVDGRRVTTAEVLQVVRDSLADVNSAVCAAIGPAAVSLFGDAIGLRATQVETLGLVGHPSPSAPPAVEEALAAGRIPVVAPLAMGSASAGSLNAQPLNVNADEAAAALAVGLGAERIVFVSDVPGVLIGGVVVEHIAADDADRMLGDGSFEGGIVPKLEAAVRATRGGVRAAIGSTEVVA